ncbi:MAG: HWE histidine kinase domain-containing protein [Hyphomicrobium sp.]
MSAFITTRAPVRVFAYAICLAVLVPSLSFAAYLLTQMHAQELGSLRESAQSRAALAAAFVDDQMASLIATLKGFSGTPAAASESRYASLRSELDQKGILLFVRGANLDLLSPTSGVDEALTNLSKPARVAATAALSTFAPQITPYGASKDGGVNVWVAAPEKDAAPILLQARIPSAYLTSALKNFVSDGLWSMAVICGNGQVFAGSKALPSKLLDTQASGNAALIQAFADTSQFGWKVAAGVPSSSIEARTRRNWMTFVAISSLLAMASFTGATLLTRSLLEEPKLNNLMQAAAMPSPTDHRQTSRQGRPAGAADRMRVALQAGNIGVWEFNLKTGLVHWDGEIARIFNLHPGDNDHVGRDFLRRVVRPDRSRLLKALTAALAGDAPLAVEVRIRRPDSEIRWIAVRGALAGGADGSAAREMAGVAYDITDQRLNLTRTHALLREVSHRSKNLLALILAMARLTARDAVDVKSHLKDFTLRVAGLSASQDLIVASDWQSVDLATLATAEIGAVARTDADRIVISGPPVSLTPEAAQTLGMVITELTLNAAQHGALTSAKGAVKLSWEFPDDETISLSWRETGGPEFVMDGPRGYGRSVVERFSTQGLKLAAHAAADAHGFQWTLVGPLANIGTRHEKTV